MTRNLSMWRARTVFVTGATGLLGGWMVKRLVQLGAEVVVLIRDGSPRSLIAHEGYLSKVATVSGSVEDLSTLTRAFCDYAPGTVFHLAAQPLVGVAKMDPVGTLRTNVAGSWNVLEAARLAKVSQVVVASSDKAYGDTEELPYRETHRLQGRYPYDVSKSCTDLICGMYAATYALPVAVVRCANLFGGGDLNFSRTVPGVIRSTLNRERFVIRSDGKFIRDFLYVKDAVEGYLALSEALAQDPSLVGEAFNFSMETQVTVLDLVGTVIKLMGGDLEPIILNQANAEIRAQYMSCEKARSVLGWAPSYTMESGLIETIDWYREWSGAPTREGAVTAFA